MTDLATALMSSWQFEPFLTLALLACALVYLRGWLALHRSMPDRYPLGRLACFMSGLAMLWLALASPIDPLGGLLLQAHMVQHLLLMMIAPPLLLLGWPGPPLLRGLPWRLRSALAGPLLNSTLVKRLLHLLVHPAFAWTVFVVATWVWHAPGLYETALLDTRWHDVEHATFLLVSVLFWWPVIQPWPSRPIWPRWTIIPYLLLADLQNTVFSAAFTFWTTPIYDLYASGPRLLGLSALDDQATAGAIMWVVGSAAFLLPVGWLLVQQLSPRLVRPSLGAPPPTLALAITPDGTVHLPIHASLQAAHGHAPRRAGDLLRTPVLGPMLRSRRVRRGVQFILLLGAAVLVYDGLSGPRNSPMNMAGVMPWTYWRGFVVLGLLLAGNLFCWSCPFMLPREFAKKLRLDRMAWPQLLRNKWLAIALLLLFLWSYEALSLWDSPWWTAWIIVGYFGAAFIVDLFFKGASFCKWVCPIGQFHFVESMCSPRSVQILDEKVCTACDTHDCINGGPRGRGCETGLYLPAKRGSMDCTWCMDCVRACPHDNIGLLPRALGSDLLHAGWRGGVGRVLERPDTIALVALLLMGAFANAIGMTAPVLALEDTMTAAWNLKTHILPATVIVLGLSVVVPLIMLPLLGGLGGRLGGRRLPLLVGTGRLTMSLFPMGFAMWLVHMVFHLCTSIGTAIPVTQRFINDTGLFAGTPAWTLACCLAIPDWLVPLELLILDAGLVASIILLYRSATHIAHGTRRLLLCGLWMPCALALYALAVWIILQPMQMRGTLLP
jgi:cytochrome c oxidase assembly factor CtaG